ncbi:MAG TPA: 2-dehydropantoate 2-reductase N-terminal domain-containing protein [bacterium]|nr:2-dehydropantoate 2-reductase N-terminal domain-containing protein [bacterium]
MARIVVVGCGGIGGLAGLYMVRAGESVLFVDQNADHVRAIQRRGLSVNGVYGPMAIGPQRACTPADLSEPLDGLVFLACKSQATATAVTALLPHLTAASCIVSLQNGMNEATIAGLVGRERTMGALPDYGGAYLEPGVLEAVHEGTVYVGELDGRFTPRAREAARLLGIGPNKCELLDDIVGRLWTKQVYNSHVVLTALVDAPLVDVLGSKKVQRLGGVLVREAMRVSDAAGVQLRRDAWFDPALYHPGTPDETERLLGAYDKLCAHLGGHQVREEAGDYRYVKKASGIHWDIVYRKRKSEAAFLTVACVANRYGVQVPLNTRLVGMIGEIEDGRRRLGWHNVDELAGFAETLGETLP